MATNVPLVEDNLKASPSVDYTPDEIAYRGKLIQQLTTAKRLRDASQPELDDMDYLTYYETNAKAANSYIPPKTNIDDTRIVTGKTKEKENTLLSALLNYNLEGNIVAYDEHDLIINELGENIEDLVKKSRELEDYDSKKPLIYKELLDQGDVFVEEVYVEQFAVKKALADKFEDWSEVMINPSKVKKIEGQLKKVFEGCAVNMLSGMKVYMGNIREYDERKQPYLFTAEIIPRSVAEQIYGKWERWPNVPRQVVKFDPTDKTLPYQNWSLLEVEDTEMVEVIKYQNKPKNEFMILLNGVMMLPIGFPLTAISPSGEYTVAKGSIEPISNFYAYSKSIPAKTKVDQAVADEMLKLIVLKTQQSYKPPMANNTGRTLAKTIWSPGTTHNNIDVSKLQPIVDARGVTPSEFSAFDLINKIIDEKTTSPAFSGDTSKGSQTATEIIEMKKQTMMKLGLTIWGVIQLEKKLTWLRIHNLMANYTKPVGEDVVSYLDAETNTVKQKIVETYRTFMIDTNLENGKDGRRIVEFNPELAQNMTPEQVMEQEDFMTKETGVPTRITYLNPQQFASLKANFFITIVPTEKDSSELQRVLFTQNIRDAAGIFGVQSLNMDYLKERFAILAKEDPDKFFTKQQPQMAMPAGPEGQGGGGGDLAAQLQAGVGGPQQPSLNALIGNAG